MNVWEAAEWLASHETLEAPTMTEITATFVNTHYEKDSMNLWECLVWLKLDKPLETPILSGMTSTSGKADYDKD